jgi:phosphoglycerate dehydrogenase-like enzyme
MGNPSLPEWHPPRTAVLYMPLDDLDATAGRALLEAAGVAVLDLDDGPSNSELAAVVALLVGYDRVDGELFDRLPALRLVATHSAGFDMVDVDEVRRRGLWLANLPGGATEEVASHALGMALALIRQLPRFDRRVRAGVWEEPVRPLPRVPAELTCAVLGLGRAGQAFARMAGPLFGRVVGYDPGLPAEAWPEGVERYDEVAAVLGTADCVSLHLPLTPQTRHLLDARTIALLPEGAVVVNVSRGELVDTAVLVEALRAGHLGGAACDVFENEPPDPGEPLLQRADVLLSPHVAYLSEASLRRYAETPARNVLALLESGRPLTPVVTPG